MGPDWLECSALVGATTGQVQLEPQEADSRQPADAHPTHGVPEIVKVPDPCMTKRCNRHHVMQQRAVTSFSCRCYVLRQLSCDATGIA